MKKLFSVFVVVIMLVAIVAMVGCVNDTDNSPKEYNIACSNGDNYTIQSSMAKAKAGDKVTLTVKANDFYQIEWVKANDTECAKVSDGKYEFTMPEKDVEITVSVKAMSDVSADDGMVWVFAPEQIASLGEEDDSYKTTQTFEVSFGDDLLTASTNDKGHMIYTNVYSINESVIPNDAISIVKATETQFGWQAVGAQFSIDLTKIKQGETKLVFEDTENDRVITKTIKVVGYGEVTPKTLFEEKVVIDLSELTGSYENLRIWIIDEEYVVGSVYDEYQIADFKFTDENYEFSFKYTPEHKFAIQIGYEYFDENVQDTRYSLFDIREVVTGGSSTTGFTGIMNGGEISFESDNQTITAVVLEKE